MTQEQVIRAFVDGDHHASASNMFIQNGTLYSRYAAFDPFPLARRIFHRSEGTNTVLLNGDVPDPNTRWARRPGWGREGVGNWVSREHQRLTMNNPRLRNFPRVSFSLLQPDQANLDPQTTEVADFTPDIEGQWVADTVNDGVTEKWKRNEAGKLVDSDGRTIDDAVPVGAMRTYNRIIHKGAIVNSGARWVREFALEDDDEAVSCNWHRIGSVLLHDQAKSNGRFLCSMDESSYFVSNLPNDPVTIDEAFQALKPVEVNNWEKAAGEAAKRQGEWFFLKFQKVESLLVPVHLLREPYVLPRNHETSNKHQAKMGWDSQMHDLGAPPIPEQPAAHQVTGRVVHLTPEGNPSREHADLDLGSGWYQSFRNTSLGDWTIPASNSRGPMVD